MVFLEKLDECPQCGRMLDQVEMDGQHCGECCWVSEDILAGTAAERDVIRERRRQQDVEGFTRESDDRFGDEELAQAADCYALPRKITGVRLKLITLWPWAPYWWKPKDRRTDLVRAGALVLAEIERLDRVAAAQSGGQE